MQSQTQAKDFLKEPSDQENITKNTNYNHADVKQTQIPEEYINIIETNSSDNDEKSYSDNIEHSSSTEEDIFITPNQPGLNQANYSYSQTHPYPVQQVATLDKHLIEESNLTEEDVLMNTLKHASIIYAKHIREKIRENIYALKVSDIDFINTLIEIIPDEYILDNKDIYFMLPGFSDYQIALVFIANYVIETINETKAQNEIKQICKPFPAIIERLEQYRVIQEALNILHPPKKLPITKTQPTTGNSLNRPALHLNKDKNPKNKIQTFCKHIMTNESVLLKNPDSGALAFAKAIDKIISKILNRHFDKTQNLIRGSIFNSKSKEGKNYIKETENISARLR